MKYNIVKDIKYDIPGGMKEIEPFLLLFTVYTIPTPHVWFTERLHLLVPNSDIIKISKICGYNDNTLG